MRLRFFPLLLLLAGCPEELGQQCPPNGVAIGQYAYGLAGQHLAGECKSLQSDGGKLPLAADDGGVSPAVLCTTRGDDGGPQLYLSIAGRGQRPAVSFGDGGFRFVGHADPTPGTACLCAVAIDDTFDGVLTGAWDGSFPVLPDGGLPLVTGFSGSLVQNLTAPSDAGCLCDLPCSVTWTVTGSRY
ncbi:MAG: hypothetical protein E6J78_02595 [Deltaproteobacteria bacterium]|nr:MAG: hypothetical protein E6J78_02595 [Deltaproteobacteria bacterium]